MGPEEKGEVLRDQFFEKLTGEYMPQTCFSSPQNYEKHH